MIKYFNGHLELLLSFQERTQKFYLLSAPKQKKVLELKEAGLMNLDEESYVHLSASGVGYLEGLNRKIDSDFRTFFLHKKAEDARKVLPDETKR